MNGIVGSCLRATRRSSLSLLALGAVLGTSAVAQAQKCFPDCRDGYVCVRGECVSACNPPCPEGERCTSDGDCVADAAPSPQPASAVATSVVGSYVAPPNKALIVFVRPAKLGKAVKFYVVDEDKRFLTMLKGNQHVMIAVEPGKHTFYVISENAGLVRADLAAGRTYVIETRPKMGMGKARVAVQPVLRNTPRFAESAKWLRDTKPYDPDLEDGANWVRKHQPVVQKRIGKAEEDWSRGDESYRATLSMSAEDGRTQEEAGRL
jgi:hypothetical protein